METTRLDLSGYSKAHHAYVEAGYRDPEADKPAPPAPDRAGGPAPSDVRAWARKRGIAVSDKGRVPAEVLQSYLDAHA